MKVCDFYREPKSILIQHSPIIMAELGARQCYDSYHAMTPRYKEDKGLDKKDLKDHIISLLEKCPEAITEALTPNISFIREIGLLKKHESILEHCFLTFHLEFPRNVLQEISRHRIGVSPSVESTRFTLNALRFMLDNSNDDGVLSYIQENIGIQDPTLNLSSAQGLIKTLDTLNEIKQKMTNDILKNLLPENWWTKGQYTFTLRALKHMFDLRLSPGAFMPFRRLVYNMYQTLPDTYKELFAEDYVANLNDIEYKWKNQEI